jgi:hypothetical protein
VVQGASGERGMRMKIDLSETSKIGRVFDWLIWAGVAKLDKENFEKLFPNRRSAELKITIEGIEISLDEMPERMEKEWERIVNETAEEKLKEQFHEVASVMMEGRDFIISNLIEKIPWFMEPEETDRD